MAIATVAVPRHAAVPDAPGVPPMLRVYQALDKITILASDAAQLAKAFQPPQWGIFSASGAVLLQADSIVAVDYRREYRISDYPVEQGGFASFNKVTEPADIRVTMAISGKGTVLSNLASGGSLGAIISGNDAAQNNRAQFLNTLAAASATLDLVTVITPEQTYPGLNIVHFDYRRDARNGATLITVDVWLREIRETATSQFAQTAAPSGSDPTSGGTVQASSMTPAQALYAGVSPV